MQTPPKTIKTEDGSHSLYVESLNEHYHSTKGAVQESQHIFIDAALKQKTEKKLHILEIGLGTGLNAFLTANYAEKTDRKIMYTSIEKYPLNSAITNHLNYAEKTGVDKSLFQQIHAVPWGSVEKISEYFEIKKIKTDIINWKPSETYDIIYFDTFAPDKQPKVWSLEIFKNLTASMNTGAVFITYSAKGMVRRWLQTTGLEVERIPGPPGKKHITRAWKR